MPCSKAFKVLVVAMAINVCYAANIPIPREGEVLVTTEVQQLTDSNGEFNPTDRRVEQCKKNCIQRCLENRKLIQASDDSHNPNKIESQSQQQPNFVHEQCLGGCTEACSFYKRLLTGKSAAVKHETLSSATDDNSLGNGHTKSSFVTGDSVISQQTTQKSVTSSPVSDYTSPTTRLTTSTTTTEAQIHQTYHSDDDDNKESSQKVADSSVAADKDLGGVEESFELRVASLIHQKSLVITELKWDDIGGIPNQAYLVTWELTDGGLKGHLVTDSSSVTLSLWPNSVYQIQVQQFKPMLEADGTQHADSSAVKSVPLIVDTNEASFPLGRSSPLFSNEEHEEYNLDDHSLYHEEDEYAQYGNEMEEEGEEEENEGHKSNEGLRSMTSLLGVSLCATVLVLVLLSLAAFTWIHFQSLRKVECFSCCFTSGEEPQLLSHEDLSDVLCTSGNSTPTTGRSLKFYRMPSLFGSKEYKISGLLHNQSEVPISAICSASTLSHSKLHCSLNNAWNSSQKEVLSAQDRITSISESVSDGLHQ